jgi:hypothetical protein
VFEFIFNWRETKSDFLRGWNDASNQSVTKINKNESSYKILYWSLLTMIAIFVFESINNWNESKEAFMKAYHEGRDSNSTLITK